MIRLSLTAGVLLVLIGAFGICFPQLFGNGAAGDQPNLSAKESVAEDTSNKAHENKLLVDSESADSKPGSDEVVSVQDDSTTAKSADEVSLKAGDGRQRVATIDRIVVAGIVLPAGAGFYFLLASVFGRQITKANSWLFVGLIGAVPAALMLLLSAERIVDWFRVPWSIYWIPVLQLLFGAVVAAFFAFQIIQKSLPLQSETVDGETADSDMDLA